MEIIWHSLTSNCGAVMTRNYVLKTPTLQLAHGIIQSKSITRTYKKIKNFRQWQTQLFATHLTIVVLFNWLVGEVQQIVFFQEILWFYSKELASK